MTATSILVAEDEEHIAKLIQFKLSKEGFQVTWARNGQEAIDRIRERPGDFGAIVLDVMMPIRDGWEVLQFLRASEGELARLPVLMLTAKGEQQVAAKASELGATEVLPKPFDPEELVKALRRISR